MFNDNTAIKLTVVTLLMFFIGGITGVLNNPFYLSTVVGIYLIILINVFIHKVSKANNPEILEEDKQK